MCSIGIIYGDASLLYSFPNHPMNKKRIESFWQKIQNEGLLSNENVHVINPVLADIDTLLLFHSKEYIEFVKMASENGYGYLDKGDTPVFKGIFEAASYSVGSTMLGLDMIMNKKCNHAFNPVGGYHHARRKRAEGFCVFNDIGIAIISAKQKYNLNRILYVDIDAHHGDGVCYEFYDDPTVYIGDIHEDGSYLYPGTGFNHETGSGQAEGTKLNLNLQPEADDDDFKQAFEKIEKFAYKIKPELIIFQCGADGLINDPITHLKFTVEAHRYATTKLHEISHDTCDGRLLALGGGGYNLKNVADAWTEVVKVLST